MRKHVKKIACALAMTFLVSAMSPLARTAYADNRKEFTYAEQISGAKVTTLQMKKGEKVDLKFKGVSDYKNYTLNWTSSNEKVAVVDGNGLITALSDGIATITLKVGDGSKYKSTGVIVTVGNVSTPTPAPGTSTTNQAIKIGTALNNTPYYYAIGLNQTVDLNAYAGIELPAASYIYSWSSTNTAVATVDANGKVTPKANGITVIMLTLTNRNNGTSMNAMPVAVQVGQVTGTATDTTPVPTATPTPTVKPNATPVPSTNYVPYTVVVDSDHSVTLKFSKKVSFKAEDVELYQLLEMGSDDVEIKINVSEAELNSTATEMTVVSEEFFTPGSSYLIKVGPADNGKSFDVNFSEPDRMEMVYSCMDKEWTAYAYDDEIGLDVPVQLTYTLYDGSIDVTESYKDEGYVSIDLIAPEDSEYVNLDGENLYFYASNVTAIVRGTYVYTDEDGNDKEITDDVNVTSKKMAAYNVTGIEEWTIIDESDTTLKAIDWENPVHKAIAGGENYKVVALLKDSYGYYYSTDPRGVDESKNIYAIDDPDTLFVYQGYTYEFNATNTDKFIIGEDGELYPYETTSRAVAYVTLYNDDKWNSGKKDLGAFQMEFMAESKLASIKIEETSVSLITNAANNEERFCQVDIPILLFDQYNSEWKGEADLEISCTVSDISKALDDVESVAPAYIKQGLNDGEYYLHVDAQNIKALSSRTSISLTVTETETKKKDSVTISLKNPTTTSEGKINVNSWSVGMKEDTITFGDGDLNEKNAQAAVEVYQVSKNGMKVGLHQNGLKDEYDNTTKIIIQESKIQSFTYKNCKPGEIYVLIEGPDNTVVEKADSANDLGVWQDSTTGEIFVNVTSLDTGDNTLSYLEEGKYTVTVTRITKVSGTRVTKYDKETSFQVVDNTKDVSVRNIKATETSLTVNGEDDLEGIRDIIAELFVFNLGNEVWKDMTPDMITAVKYTTTTSNNYVRITSIDFAVPADGKSTDADTIVYKKTVKKINKTIRTGVYDD